MRDIASLIRARLAACKAAQLVSGFAADGVDALRVTPSNIRVRWQLPPAPWSWPKAASVSARTHHVRRPIGRGSTVLTPEMLDL